MFLQFLTNIMAIIAFKDLLNLNIASTTPKLEIFFSYTKTRSLILRREFCGNDLLEYSYWCVQPITAKVETISKTMSVRSPTNDNTRRAATGWLGHHLLFTSNYGFAFLYWAFFCNIMKIGQIFLTILILWIPFVYASF